MSEHEGVDGLESSTLGAIRTEFIGVNMDLATAALIFATKLTDTTWNPNWGPYDHQTMGAVVSAIVKTTTDLREVETLIRIARWESGAFRKDVANCKILGKIGERGVFQVWPINEQEKNDLCSSDLTKQVAVALSHINDSITTCKRWGLKGSNLLTVYTHGRCHVAKDKAASMRWGTGDAIQAIFDTAEEETQ